MKKTLVLTALILTGLMPGNIGTKSAQAHLTAYKLRVWRTGYTLTGTTATGKKTRWGIVAVDPDYIPLHSRMSIPGYGTGYAEDTGGMVNGLHIDVWVPTVALARKLTGTVTITVYR